MWIGCLGKFIVFEVGEKALTFDNMKRTVSGRWAAHERIGRRPTMEYLGPGQETASLDITISRNLGVNPYDVKAQIEIAAASGEPFRFVIGGRNVGANLWIIESVSESWSEVVKDGELWSCSCSLTLKEYVE